MWRLCLKKSAPKELQPGFVQRIEAGRYDTYEQWFDGYVEAA
jgi:hypothetical protein